MDLVVFADSQPFVPDSRDRDDKLLPPGMGPSTCSHGSNMSRRSITLQLTGSALAPNRIWVTHCHVSFTGQTKELDLRSLPALAGKGNPDLFQFR
jgi:hypothetical protein